MTPPRPWLDSYVIAGPMARQLRRPPSLRRHQAGGRYLSAFSQRYQNVLYSRVVVWRATTLLTTERIVVPRRIYRTPLLTLPHSHAPRGGAQRGRHGVVPPRRPHNERRPLRRNAHYRSPHGLRFTPHLGCAVVRVRQSVHKIHSAEWLRLMLVAHGARTRRSVHPGPNPQVACRTPWPATTHMKRQHASVNAQRARTPSRVLCASEGVRAV